MTSVPFNDLRAHHAPLREAFHQALDQLLDSCAFVGGPAVADFEKDFASFCGVKESVACANGTDALVVGLKALGISAGDVVLTVANTFIATTEAISLVGAKIAFVDVDPHTYTMCPQALAKVLDTHPDKKRIRCVIPVHLYGQPADMKAIQAVLEGRNIELLADCAQVHGAKIDGLPVSKFAKINTFSFYPGKNLGALGDAGAISTEDEQMADWMRRYINHGRQDKYRHAFEGVNSRLDTLQALFLIEKLRLLPEKTALRQKWAKEYNELLKNIPAIQLPPALNDRPGVYHLYVIQVDNRDQVAAKLGEKGIQTGIHYPLALHHQPAYQHFANISLPVTEAAYPRLLTLPLYPEMSPDAPAYVAETLKSILGVVAR